VFLGGSPASGPLRARRGTAVVAQIPADTNPPRGSSHIMKRYHHSPPRTWVFRGNMKMSRVCSSCMPAAFLHHIRFMGNGHEQSVRTRMMKIIKSGNPMRAPSPPGLSEVRRGSAVFTNMLTGTDPLRGRPVGGSGVHHKKKETDNHSITHLCLIQFSGEILVPGSDLTGGRPDGPEGGGFCHEKTLRKFRYTGACSGPGCTVIPSPAGFWRS
jgi:hypothetical protein